MKMLNQIKYDIQNLPLLIPVDPESGIANDWTALCMCVQVSLKCV